MTDKHFVVILGNQINVYDHANFSLELKKENMNNIINAYLIEMNGVEQIAYLEDKTR